jgi:hypothetical protein
MKLNTFVDEISDELSSVEKLYRSDIESIMARIAKEIECGEKK